MKTLIQILLTLTMILGCQPVFANAVIFSGSDVKALKSNLDLNGGIKVMSASTDPTSSATSATRGSILCNTGGGNCYVKQDSGSSTNWNRLVFGSSSGILGLAQGGSAKAITASAGSVLYSDSDSFETSAVGTSGQILISGGTGAPTWSSSPNVLAVYRAVVTTDSVGATDYTMKLSGASFTSTLPTAVSVAGKRYKFVHSGTSLSQVYTINTTSSQTVGGFASGAVKLIVNGQVLEVESDGANWLISSMYYPDKLTQYTPTLTNMASVSTNTATYIVKAGRVKLQGKIVLSGAVGGDAQIALPSGLTIDTTHIGTAARADLGIFSYVDASDSSRIQTSAGSAFGYGALRIRYASTTTVYLGFSYYLLNASQPITWATGDEIHWEAELPISTVGI